MSYIQEFYQITDRWHLSSSIFAQSKKFLPEGIPKLFKRREATESNIDHMNNHRYQFLLQLTLQNQQYLWDNPIQIQAGKTEFLITFFHIS